jgi:DNA (cytosine-5)-methyltransferase 1
MRSIQLESKLTSIEFCAGAGGQALGIERAGFEHKLLVDNDEFCIQTLKHNRPHWNSVFADMNGFCAQEFHGVDLFAGGLPCPPFSVAGKQLGKNDERNLFPAALNIIKTTQPKFVLIENVRGFLSSTFTEYREQLRASFDRLGYKIDWRLFNASDFGVPQLRPRVMIVAAKEQYWPNFSFPAPYDEAAPNVGETLYDLMAANGWQGAKKWAAKANKVAPTIVGGSKKHGGPDLGPTRAREAWLKLGVNGKSIAESPPERGFSDIPRLTPRMVARIQGFPDDWFFSGKKTNAYRQIGNAFPPPVAEAIAKQIHKAIVQTDTLLIAAE